MPNTPLNISIDDAERIGKAISPSIRESMREDIDQQTEELKDVIQSHDKNVRELIHTHELTDESRFSTIDKTLKQGDTRMSHIETKLSWGAGVVAALVIIIPIGWDLLKVKLGIK